MPPCGPRGDCSVPNIIRSDARQQPGCFAPCWDLDSNQRLFQDHPPFFKAGRFALRVAELAATCGSPETQFGMNFKNPRLKLWRHGRIRLGDLLKIAKLWRVSPLPEYSRESADASQ
jgi:hypothetical protein